MLVSSQKKRNHGFVSNLVIVESAAWTHNRRGTAWKIYEKVKNNHLTELIILKKLKRLGLEVTYGLILIWWNCQWRSILTTPWLHQFRCWLFQRFEVADSHHPETGGCFLRLCLYCLYVSSCVSCSSIFQCSNITSWSKCGTGATPFCSE